MDGDTNLFIDWQVPQADSSSGDAELFRRGSGTRSIRHGWKRVDLSSMLLAVRQHLFQLFRVATSSPATRRRIFAYLAFARARAAGSASSGGSTTQVRTYCNRLFPLRRGTSRNPLPSGRRRGQMCPRSRNQCFARFAFIASMMDL